MSSLAQGIKLAPMRMGDIKAKPLEVDAINATASNATTKSYVPPYKLKGTTTQAQAVLGPATLDMTDAAFPTLGVSATLGPSKKATHVPTNQKFKQTILNLIEKDQMEESERQRLLNGDIDPLTMTNKHLQEEGWVVKPLKNTHEIYKKFNAFMVEQDARIKEISDFYNLSSISGCL